MKIKISDLRTAAESIGGLLTSPLPVQFSWRLSRFTKSLSTELQGIEEKRNELIRKYSSSGKQVDSDKVDKFTAEWNSLLNEEVEIDFEKIRLSEINGALIPPATFIGCGFLFEE